MGGRKRTARADDRLADRADLEAHLSSRAHRVLEKPGSVAIYAFSKLAASPSI
jgi:hypothetical protein